MELSPSRLKLKVGQNQGSASLSGPRSKSVPPRPSAPNRPPSRLKSDKDKSSNYPPVSSLQQFRKLPAPLSLTSQGPIRPTYSQALTAAPTPSSASSGNGLSPKFSTLRSQKSHTGLKPPSPPTTRRLTRKASLPALESTALPVAASGLPSLSSTSRYDAHTASSRAKIHTHSTSRISGLDYTVPPTRPSTPSSNPVALRLTMPTSSSKLKARVPISSVFPQTGTARSASPLPPSQQASSSMAQNRPHSASSRPRSNQATAIPPVPAPRMLKRPKRLKTYGDGTELDDIEDLPLDREKEGRYRVQPKAGINRVPGASYTPKDATGSNTSTGESAAARRILRPEPSGIGNGMFGIAIASCMLSNSLQMRSLRQGF